MNFLVKTSLTLFIYLPLFSWIHAQEVARERIAPSFIPPAVLTETDTPLVPELSQLCTPGYTTGCNEGDGFTDFALAEIENYGSGCANNTGFSGWSQYLGLGPALLLPGNSYDCSMKTGYGNQFVSIWIDFNDDYTLTPDEKVLDNFVLTNANQLYTTTLAVPSGASIGLHMMRARTNWSSPANDPCTNYTYGEAEDYMVMVGEASFGSMGGSVNLFTGGAPVSGASISMTGQYAFYSITTGSNGTYLINNVLVGEYDVQCFKEGYNVENVTVTIEEDVLLTQNFQLTQPEIYVTPLTLEMELEQNQQGTESFTISNSGDGELHWSASIIVSNSDDLYDLQFQYPTAGGGGEAGIESDGTYIYTTRWNGPEIMKYDLEGNLLETFTIPGVLGLRDLAYDGSHFYGSAGIPVLYEMDFESKVLVGQVSVPVSIRAIAYNADEDLFYVNNWSEPVTILDKSGNVLGSFNVGPAGSNYYGFAYDHSTPGGPYLWGYAQTTGLQNKLIQMQLPSGNETGLIIDMKDKLTGNLYNGAGGLFMEPNLVYGKWTLGGVVQNQFLWGLDMGDSQTWLSVSPNSGTIQPGETSEVEVLFDATDLNSGVYQAGIQVTSWPAVGNPVIEVTLTVTEALIHPCNLEATFGCTDMTLTWEMCPPGMPDPDSYNIYRDGTLLGNTPAPPYTDALLYPGTTYTYTLTGLYGFDETLPSSPLEVMVPTPSDLEPVDFTITAMMDSIVCFSWGLAACLAPDYYTLYRNNVLLAQTGEAMFCDTLTGSGWYEYYVTATYYFGESGPSPVLTYVWQATGIAPANETEPEIYPNPASEVLFIHSGTPEGRVIFYSAAGKRVLEINFRVHRPVDVSGLEPGMYIIQLNIDKHLYYRKMILR